MDVKPRDTASLHRDITISAQQVCYPLRVEKMNMSLQSDNYFVLSIGESTGIKTPQRARYHDVLYRWDCATFFQDCLDSSLVEKCVALILDKWEAYQVPENWKLAKHILIHLGLPETEHFFYEVDLKNTCIRFPRSAKPKKDKPKEKVPLEVWARESSITTLAKHIEEHSDLIEWMKCNPSSSIKHVPEIHLDKFAEEQLPTGFKYPVIHFKLIPFSGGLCQLGTTAGDSITQLHLPEDGCSHHKFAQPGTPARLVTEEDFCELMQKLKSGSSKNGLLASNTLQSKAD